MKSLSAKQGYTKGPWTVARINEPMGNHKTNRQMLYRIEQEQRPIGLHDTEEAKANAALIAAAPKLMALLKRVAEREETDGIGHDLLAEIDEAICKAEGRA